ncbi:hypothetical protein Nepgr_017596 [Nepenthes gracilis]|uniref:Uncharacterized protein n=1 Tax=Nepenthes gracilis TaxID=150966 RepID=A0AAD3SPN1_NEPGR|nr:hypothetical protein Nepgr_017596 [Nepenthes gracilis]
MGSDHGVVQSSIVLLQERFRQLRREAEMRERREIFKMFSVSENHANYYPAVTFSSPSSSSTQYYPPLKFFFHPDLVSPSAAHHHLSLSDHHFSLSLAPCSLSKTTDFHAGQTAPFVDAMSCDKLLDSVSDVDTSLHL